MRRTRPMGERWRRKLKRIEELRPTDELLGQARLGPRADLPERRPVSWFVTAVVAFGLFAAAGGLAWRALVPSGGAASVPVWEPGYQSPPVSGYYVLFPDHADPSSDQPFSSEVTALTNLPDGTLVSITTTNEGSCCPPVKDGKITFTTQDSSCYGLVGAPLSVPGFTETITARPDIESIGILGPAIGPGGDTWQPPEQPEAVLRILGQHFENLSGDQVVEQPDGSKQLVAKGGFTWPQPRCGGDAIPLFGGPKCNPDDYQQQLQGHDLDEAMVDVMGAISQGRMCEFWSTELPPEIEAEHPWPQFASEWRDWLMQQDFSDANSSSNWQDGALRWQFERHEGGRSVIEVIHNDQTIATLHLEPLPDYCPHCDPNVVPFWGVVAWTLR